MNNGAINPQGADMQTQSVQLRPYYVGLEHNGVFSAWVRFAYSESGAAGEAYDAARREWPSERVEIQRVELLNHPRDAGSVI